MSVALGNESVSVTIGDQEISFETGKLAKQADGAVVVRSGETIVLAGFSRERQVTERRNAGYKGGWFGRSTVTVTKRTELVILLTPRVLTGAVTQ